MARWRAHALSRALNGAGATRKLLGSAVHDYTSGFIARAGSNACQSLAACAATTASTASTCSRPAQCASGFVVQEIPYVCVPALPGSARPVPSLGLPEQRTQICGNCLGTGPSHVKRGKIP
jgi:hypothetical protein